MTLDKRWLDVLYKNKMADDQFVYAVKTTGIYCRPSCSAKVAKQKNVEFFDEWSMAESAGYRACKKCHPKGESIHSKNQRLMTEACQKMVESEDEINLQTLANDADMSSYFFQRTFKKIIGVTPKQYSIAIRAEKMKQNLSKRANTITTTAYDSGFNSIGRFYAASEQHLGMTPSTFRQGAKEVIIQFAVTECFLGLVLVALTPKGICAVHLGESKNTLIENLQKQYPAATFIESDAEFNRLIKEVISYIEHPQPKQNMNIPLDIKGTAFQQRVWQLLMDIPRGTITNYSEIAEKLGEPKAVRAVANACAKNNIAVLIPCHRVVKKNGAVSGYRWGVERKEKLLKHEKKQCH